MKREMNLVPDGMPIRNGRFVGGPTTVLRLEGDQARGLPDQRELVLSRAQREALRGAIGEAPRTLWIYDTRIGENDCCCDAQNRGLRFSEAQIDVPHVYVRGYQPPSAADWLMLTVLALPLLARSLRLFRSGAA